MIWFSFVGFGFFFLSRKIKVLVYFPPPLVQTNGIQRALVRFLIVPSCDYSPTEYIFVVSFVLLHFTGDSQPRRDSPLLGEREFTGFMTFYFCSRNG